MGSLLFTLFTLIYLRFSFNKNQVYLGFFFSLKKCINLTRGGCSFKIRKTTNPVKIISNSDDIPKHYWFLTAKTQFDKCDRKCDKLTITFSK